MISVVIPAFNAEQTIGRTISAVLEQTLAPAEILVVNDGSTDGTAHVVKRVNDKRVRVVDQLNRGVAAARNRGAREARNEIVAFCDADDVWERGFLATIAELHESYPRAGVFATAYRLAPPDRPARAARLRTLRFCGERGLLEAYFDVASRSDPPIDSSAVAVKRKALFGVGGFPEGIVSGEDLLTWARLAARYEIAYSRRPLSTFYCPARTDFRRPAERCEEVGRALAALADEVDAQHKAALQRYVSRWFEMRTVIALGQHDLRRARKHMREVLRFGPLTLRSMALAGLCGLPAAVAVRLFEYLRTVR